MPSQEEVEKALLKSLYNHNGTIKEFTSGEEIVEEIADEFNLTEEQKRTYLETIYRKENRIKKSSLWHRLLYRAADSLAKQKMVSRPSHTYLLTNRKEWMLTERGYNIFLDTIKISRDQNKNFDINTYEVVKTVKKLKKQIKPNNYMPIYKGRRSKKVSKITDIRDRSFRQIVIQEYDYRCSICGLKIYSPVLFQWEVEAAHIIPQSRNGRSDIWNGLSLCHFHHWAFDVGWFSLSNDFRILTSKHINDIPSWMGNMWDINIIQKTSKGSGLIVLPENKNFWPDQQAINWHRENILK